MADHRGRRRLRNLLGPLAAALAVLLVLAASRGTGAFWTDRAEVEGGALSSGSLDLTLRRSNNAGDAFADDVTVPSAALAGMLPGDSRTFNIAVRSAGVEAPLTYQVYGQSSPSAAPNPNVLGSSLQVEIWSTAGSATNPGGPGVGYRTDQFGTAYGATCPSGPQIGGPTALSVSAPVLLTSGPGTALAPGDVSSLCLRVTLPADVSGTAMGKSTTITFTALARSVAR